MWVLNCFAPFELHALNAVRMRSQCVFSIVGIVADSVCEFANLEDASAAAAVRDLERDGVAKERCGKRGEARQGGARRSAGRFGDGERSTH